MKKLLVLSVVCLFAATAAFAADFAPTLLKLSAEETISYEFDGSELDIPVTVTGTNAGVLFLVYTKGQADAIGIVENGFLGWHYVNKVDTCVYLSGMVDLPTGDNIIKWEGKDNDGGLVAAGDYTYYMWAYDNIGIKQPMTNAMRAHYQSLDFQEVDAEGNPLANPIFYGRQGNNGVRWYVGTDPTAVDLLETSAIPIPAGWGFGDGNSFDKSDFEYIYQGVKNADSGVAGITKWKWVPAGDAELQTDFGEDGYALYSSQTDAHSPVVVSTMDYIFTVEQGYHFTDAGSEFFVVDMEGTVVTSLDMVDWWNDSDDLDAGGQMNGGPDNHSIRNGMVFLNCHCSCLKQMVDPVRWLEADDEEEFIVWSNSNGDYILDHNFEETSEKPWVCNDYNVGPYTYNLSADDKFFSVCPAFDMGSVSFGLMAPDGTGIGHFAYAGETASPLKYSSLFLDGDTPYDGLYSDNESGEGAGQWFIGHDSIMGVISSSVAVEDDAPAAFAVAQNSPNPFNPTTTISFSLAQAGNVNVDIYNVAGQKVDTIVNEYLDSGSHSVVWDASDFSAGVYFYTVKGGDFSKTIKMTLVK